jgi:hypothetical protein
LDAVSTSRQHTPGRILALVILCASLLGGIREACAESVTIEGLAFRLEGIAPVESNLVKVTVENHEMLVPKDEVNDAIVDLYFTPEGRGRSVDSDLLGMFIERCLAAGKISYAAAALPTYLSSPRLDVLGAVDVLERISGFAGAADSFKQALLEIRSNGEAFSEFRARPELVAIVLFTIGKADGAWLRANALRWVFTFSESFRGYVLDRLSKAVSANSVEEVQSIPGVVRDALGDDHEFYLSIRVLTQRLVQAYGHQLGDPAEALYPLVEAARRDAVSSRILYPVVAEKLHAAAEHFLTEGAPARALLVLSHTDPTRRTPRTHDLVTRALTAVPANETELLRDGEAEQLLTALALRDVGIRRRYEELLARQFDFALQSNDVSRGNIVLQRMLKFRPDPYPANDDIRVELALGELRLGSRDDALATLSGVRTGIPLYDRVRLGLAGLYVSRLVAFLCIVVPTVYTIWFLLIELKRLRAFRLQRASRSSGAHVRSSSTGQVREDADSSSSAYDRNGGKSFTHNGIQKPSDPRIAEYQECLNVLGLEPAATLKEIKTAYRSLVKHIHPDRLKENQGLASDRFIQLTQAYDRAIELRRMTGQED